MALDRSVLCRQLSVQKVHHETADAATLVLSIPKEHKDITYIVEARALCSDCPVKSQCLEYALEFPPADMHGVWAGLTSRQLAAEQRRREVGPKRPTLAQMWGG